MLGEKVSGQSWAAIALGFIGVLVILQPGTALFNPAALFSLVSAATYALAMIIARKLGVSESATVMAFYQNAVYFFGGRFNRRIFCRCRNRPSRPPQPGFPGAPLGLAKQL